MAKNSKNSQCPYFSFEQGGACMIIKGGLYLPLQEQIVMYCNTPDFSSCQQYSNRKAVSQSFQPPLAATPSNNDSRRRFRRIKNNLPVAIFTCDEKGTPISSLDTDAVTLDIGIGGMKIASAHKISPNTVLAFRLGDAHRPDSLSGVGEVRWSHASQGETAFHAGLAFMDSTVPQALSSRFGLS